MNVNTDSDDEISHLRGPNIMRCVDTDYEPIAKGQTINTPATLQLTVDDHNDIPAQRTGESKHVFVPLSEGCVFIQIGKSKMPVLVDTGASVSFINPRLVTSLHKQGLPILITKIRDKVALADDKVYNINHKVTCLLYTSPSPRD